MYEDIIIRYEDIMIMARMSRRAPLRLDCSLQVPAHTTKSQQVTMIIVVMMMVMVMVMMVMMLMVMVMVMLMVMVMVMSVTRYLRL